MSSPRDPGPLPGHPSSPVTITAPLAAYGWSPDWAQRLPAAWQEDCRVGRVVAAQRTCCAVVTEAGPADAVVAGRFHQQADAIARPVVGDWACLRHADGTWVIEAIVPRRTLLRRVAAGGQDGDQAVAANVDTVFIVGGLDGDHEPRRLRRYLAFVTGGGARPVGQKGQATVQQHAVYHARPATDLRQSTWRRPGGTGTPVDGPPFSGSPPESGVQTSLSRWHGPACLEVEMREESGPTRRRR